ncbi:MAG: type II toxin-antitoxin system RelE/ParE family toxin [Clostridia bacterium]|nr:type II toxin-antitoxin system RelE/ParE family toxin [Clostridia bacterium]
MAYRILIYEDQRGRAPILEYFRAMEADHSKEARIRLTKAQDYINLLKERGTILPNSICKHFSDKKHSWLWELRPGGDRVLFFAWKDGSFVLLHAFEKKSQKTPQREIDRAEREYNDWRERYG